MLEECDDGDDIATGPTGPAGADGAALEAPLHSGIYRVL